MANDKESLYSKKGFPHKGWEYIEEEDLGSLDGECDICGHELRYEHHLYHPDYGEIVAGCYCCENLLTPYVFNEVKRRDASMKSKAHKAKRKKELNKFMKKFTGYEEAKKAASYTNEKLPAGGYVCKVMGVRYDETEWGDRIILQFDIEEGDHKGFFSTQYKNNTNEDKKWKGVVRISVPKDDGSEQDGWTKNSFARWTNSFEASNPGYIWDWDEKKWKGKLIGITFGETGTVIDGKEVVYTEARSADSVENIRAGKFYHQKFKKKNGYTGTGSSTAAKAPALDDFVSVSSGNTEEEIPF